ncbi:MAG: hypothetical protein PHP31_07555 [Lentimicrobiaceae bacterium]|nr:hypothetical protein [Lentimicrobiaceae bacterium]
MEFWQEVILSLVSFFVGGGLSSFFTIKYKSKQEKLVTTKSVVQFYKDEWIELNNKYLAIKSENEILHKRQEELQAEIDTLKKQLCTLRKNIKQ